MEPQSHPLSFDEPPAKPARGSISQSRPQERKRTLSAGYSLNSSANFYDIPAVRIFPFFWSL